MGGDLIHILLTAAVLLTSVLIHAIANCFLCLREAPQLLYAIVPVYLLINMLAGTLMIRTRSRKLRICCHGTVLLAAFYVTVITSVVYHIVLAVRMFPDDLMSFVWSALWCFAALFILFWNGIICVYLTSTQLGIKIRLIGAICGMIPVANLIALFFILRATAGECCFEGRKEQVNRRREAQRICATRYPILMVHGVFFRDSRFFNYWGRIPEELERNGASIFYGNHSSAASIADCAAELAARIDAVLAETNAEKVNIIAHSKGGLDCSYAIARLGIGDRVASLTTINTPHKGCLFADHLLTTIDPAVKNSVAAAYNAALKKFGDPDPDFLAAVQNLTDGFCRQLDAQMPAPDGIFCQSVGSVMPKAASGQFPLNLAYHLVRHFDGENDGLVSENSFPWGEKYTLLRPAGKRGISHGDMIDLNRENIKGFDVREFYVDLVSDLKTRGL